MTTRVLRADRIVDRLQTGLRPPGGLRPECMAYQGRLQIDRSTRCCQLPRQKQPRLPAVFVTEAKVLDRAAERGTRLVALC